MADFGISKILDKTLDNANTLTGTPYYMSPELVSNKPYSFKNDVWAMGCVVAELCLLKFPFKGTNVIELIQNICL